MTDSREMIALAIQAVAYGRVYRFSTHSAFKFQMKSNNTILSLEDSSLAGKTLTLEAWINRRSSAAQNTLFRIYGTNADGETVNEAKLTNGPVTFEDYPYASPWRVPNSTTNWFYSYSPASPTHIKQDAWMHVAIVRDMSVEGTVTETYYFNGAVGKTWSYTTTATETNAAFSVQGGGEPQFNIADVKVYSDLAFTDSEIKAHYNAEKTTYAQANELVSAQNSSYRLRDSNGKGVMSSSGTKDYGQSFYFETGINSPTDGVVIVALYKGDDMVGAKAVPVTTSTTSPLKVAFDGITYDSSAKYTIKAFTLDGTDTLTPYAPAKSYNFK